MNIGARSVSLADLVVKAKFRVPKYQRRFAWDGEVEQLWEDLVYAIESGQSDYFLGSIVTTELGTDGSCDVIDGQQRLATLSMFLAGIRDWFDGNDHAETGNKVHENFLVRDPYGRGEGVAVLQLSSEDDPSFTTYVVRREGESDRDSAPPRPPRRGAPRKDRVKSARDLIREKLLPSFVNGHDDAHGQLVKMFEFIASKTIVIHTTVGGDEDAYMVFESVNDRGKDLSIADLVKNHLFHLADRESSASLERVYELWTKLTTTLDGCSMQQFLRHWYLSNRGLASHRSLYRQLKEYLRSGSLQPEGFLRGLLDSAGVYAPMALGRFEENALILEGFRIMRVVQPLPFLLAAYEKSGRGNSFNLACRLANALTMRVIVVGNTNPNIVERKYSAWALRLRGGQAMEEIVRDVEKSPELWVPDNQFAEDLARADLADTQAKAILIQIEAHRRPTKGIPLSLAGVELEHIFPKAAGDDWLAMVGTSSEDADSLCSLIGNLTLLDPSSNVSISNKTFPEKRAVYESSDYTITREVASNEEWTRQIIENRSKQLAEDACQVWSLSGVSGD